jgi:hypothetical protein
MLAFNWGVFWAILAALAIKVTVEFLLGWLMEVFPR